MPRGHWRKWPDVPCVCQHFPDTMPGHVKWKEGKGSAVANTRILTPFPSPAPLPEASLTNASYVQYLRSVRRDPLATRQPTGEYLPLVVWVSFPPYDGACALLASHKLVGDWIGAYICKMLPNSAFAQICVLFSHELVCLLLLTLVVFSHEYCNAGQKRCKDRLPCVGTSAQEESVCSSVSSFLGL